MEFHIYTDGSGGDPAQATVGMGRSGVSGCQPPPRSPLCCRSIYGPVVVGEYDPVWLGARRGTNNTAEISAIGEACRWLLSLIHDLPVYHSRKITIYYDSEYAYGVTTRLTKCKDNHELVESVAQLVSATRNQFHLTFQHVKGHSGIHGNEVAHKLADRGFLGRVSPHATFWTIRPEGPMGRPPAPAPKRAPRVLRRPAAAGPRQGRHPLLPCPVCGENFRSCDLPQHQPGCRGLGI